MTTVIFKRAFRDSGEDLYEFLAPFIIHHSLSEARQLEIENSEFLRHAATCSHLVQLFCSNVPRHRRAPIPCVPSSAKSELLDKQLASMVEEEYVNHTEIGMRCEDAAPHNSAHRDVTVVDPVNEHVFVDRGHSMKFPQVPGQITMP
jgi:hypothetical protein